MYKRQVFALHTDTDNPHVHVCIKMASIKKRSKRLNPRKNDLQRWREGFAPVSYTHLDVYKRQD